MRPSDCGGGGQRKKGGLRAGATKVHPLVVDYLVFPPTDGKETISSPTKIES